MIRVCQILPLPSLLGLALFLLGSAVGPAPALCVCPRDSCDTSCTTRRHDASYNHWHDGQMPIAYYINGAGASNCNGNEFKAVQRAARNWENLHQTSWATCYGDTTSRHSSAHQPGNPPVRDSVNVVSWEDLGGVAPLTLGYAYSWYDLLTDSIIESDMSLNDNAAVSWSALEVDSCPATKYDLENIATHEFGHWMFLYHTCDMAATMYCWVKKGETKKRNPDDCDIAAMQHEYTHTWGVPMTQPGCWPVLFEDWITSHLVLGDVDRDGAEDIVFATYDSTLHVVDGRGKEVSSAWPKKFPDRLDATPALGDVDGDGWLEIAIACQNDSLYVLNHNATVASGWPRSMGFGSGATPSIADIDKDNHVDIICVSDSVRAWKGSDGTLLPGWPVYVGGLVQRAAPALADLDGDDSLEVVLPGADKKVHALKPHGAALTGWPVSTPNRNIVEPVAIGDIDGDTYYEVVAAAQYDSVYAWNANGSRCTGWPVYFTSTVGGAAPSLGNLDADAALEVLLASDEDTLHVLDGDGTAAAGWPVRIEWGIDSSPLVADVEGDGDYEVIFASEEGRLYAMHGNGFMVDGWFRHFGANCNRTPAVGDIDGNNDLEVVVSDTQTHKLFAYNLGTVLADASYGWRMYAHDWNRTARYGFEPEAPAPIIFFDGVADLGRWETLMGGGANVSPGTLFHSPPTSMQVNGSSAPGAYASAYSEYVDTDFSRPYKFKFWFRYTDFFTANWIVFGHARLRIVSPMDPVFVDLAGNWSVLAPMAVPFEDMCPAGTFVEFEVRVDPEYRLVQLYANGVFVDMHEYFETVVPSNRIWLEDREYPGEFLYANYDDFEVHGYPPVLSTNEKPSTPAPLVNVLYQSYPNPMNPLATINYSVKETGRVTLRIYDVVGRVVRELVNEEKLASPTPYSVFWDGKNDQGARVASGVYFCTMEAKKFSSAKKIVVLR